jgi:hypothetical protein
LIINGRDYVVSQTQDIEQIKEATVTIAKSGAGLLDFIGFDGREVSVLITPGVALVFESFEAPAEQDSDGPGDPAFAYVHDFDD